MHPMPLRIMKRHMKTQRPIKIRGKIHQREYPKLSHPNICITSFYPYRREKGGKGYASVGFFQFDDWGFSVAGQGGLFVVVEVTPFVEEFFQACTCPVESYL